MDYQRDYLSLKDQFVNDQLWIFNINIFAHLKYFIYFIYFLIILFIQIRIETSVFK